MIRHIGADRASSWVHCLTLPSRRTLPRRGGTLPALVSQRCLRIEFREYLRVQRGWPSHRSGDLRAGREDIVGAPRYPISHVSPDGPHAQEGEVIARDVDAWMSQTCCRRLRGSTSHARAVAGIVCIRSGSARASQAGRPVKSRAYWRGMVFGREVCAARQCSATATRPRPKTT